MASKAAQGSRRWFKIASNIPPGGPTRATRRFQVPSESPLDPPKDCNPPRKSNELWLLALMIPMRS
eukprot:653242-Pyramimonas_sp.AAC.1